MHDRSAARLAYINKKLIDFILGNLNPVDGCYRFSEIAGVRTY